MSIGVAARKLLWGRSHNQCANPGCSQQLTVDLDDPESAVLSRAGAVLGEEAHIRSGKPDGPRFDPDYPADEVDAYPNLILLCPTHHTLVDKEGGRAFSVEDLETMRLGHEASVLASESELDERLRVLSERMATRVQVWEDKVGLERWQDLTWMLNYPSPYIRDPIRQNLFDTGEWLLGQDWPNEFPNVREAFDRFTQVLRTLIDHLVTSFELNDNQQRWDLDRSYKRIPWDPPRYEKLILEYRVGSAITWFLAVEVTRAANWIISAVRSEIDPLYRFDEGIALMREGDGILRSQIVRVEYRQRAWGDPFPPLDLSSLRAAVEAAAEAEGVDPDDVNPYTLFDL